MSSSHLSDSQFARIFFGMIAVLAALGVILIGIALVASSDVNGRVAAQKDVDNRRFVEARIQPVASLAVGEQPAAPAVVQAVVAEVQAEEVSGQGVYEKACIACHGAGVAGAPKFGDQTAWTARIAQGIETLEQHAIAGFQGSAGFMPAKGGNPALSDDEVKAAVSYMVDNAK